MTCKDITIWNSLSRVFWRLGSHKARCSVGRKREALVAGLASAVVSQLRAICYGIILLANGRIKSQAEVLLTPELEMEKERLMQIFVLDIIGQVVVISNEARLALRANDWVPKKQAVLKGRGVHRLAG